MHKEIKKTFNNVNLIFNKIFYFLSSITNVELTEKQKKEYMILIITLLPKVVCGIVISYDAENTELPPLSQKKAGYYINIERDPQNRLNELRNERDMLISKNRYSIYYENEQIPSQFSYDFRLMDLDSRIKELETELNCR